PPPPATYPLSLHDALPISCDVCIRGGGDGVRLLRLRGGPAGPRQRSAAAKGRGDGSVARTSGDRIEGSSGSQHRVTGDGAWTRPHSSHGGHFTGEIVVGGVRGCLD